MSSRLLGVLCRVGGLWRLQSSRRVFWPPRNLLPEHPSVLSPHRRTTTAVQPARKHVLPYSIFFLILLSQAPLSKEAGQGGQGSRDDLAPLAPCRLNYRLGHVQRKRDWCAKVAVCGGGGGQGLEVQVFACQRGGGGGGLKIAFVFPARF